MQEILVKDFYNKIIGKIQIDSEGNKIVKDFYNRILGKYDARHDVTKDFYNRIVAKGDHCGLLISMNPDK